MEERKKRIKAWEELDYDYDGGGGGYGVGKKQAKVQPGPMGWWTEAICLRIKVAAMELTHAHI